MPVEGAAKLFAADEVGAGGVDGCVAGFDGGGVDHGAEQRGAKHALAHGRAAGVHGAEEGDVGAGFGEERVDQLEVAGGDLIEVKALGAGVEAERVNVAGFGLLRGADVVDDGSGGDGGGGMTGEAEAFEGAAAELALEERDGEVRRRRPSRRRGCGF